MFEMPWAQPRANVKLPVKPAKDDVPGDFTFVFVVNELKLTLNDPECEGDRDAYGNRVPPPLTCGYASEQPGAVFRYRGGTVSRATDCFWYRPSWGEPGNIWQTYVDTGADGNGGPVQTRCHAQPIHKTYTVFRCWRFVPYMYVGIDATVEDVCNAPEPNDQFHALRFSDLGRVWSNPDRHVTVAGSFMDQHVAGSSPSWMPGLVPPIYRNPRLDCPRSQGLTGDLPLILTMMAFSQPRGRCDDAFSAPLWRNHRWYGTGHSPDELLPRGVVVQVCFDLRHGEHSTAAAMAKFEWKSIIIHEN